jgi:hypothetical protein
MAHTNVAQEYLRIMPLGARAPECFKRLEKRLL